MPQVISNYRPITRLPGYADRQPTQNVKDYTTETVDDGTTDARAAILLADAEGPVILPPGTYSIGSSMTLTNPISFAPGAKLKPANRGVELTLTRFTAALDQQVFDITNHSAATFTASGATLSATAHNLQNGQKVWVSSTDTLPTGLAAGTVYYVVNRAADTFQLSATSGGSAITTSGAGTGTHSVKTYAPVITSNPLLTPDNFGLITAGDMSAFVQAAINSVATRGEIIFPSSYGVKDVFIPSDKRIKLNGLGGAFIALSAGGTFIFQALGTNLRDAPLEIEGFRFVSAGKLGIGVELNNRITATVSRCAFEAFDTGLILHSSLSNHVRDTVVSSCRVGLKLRASATAFAGQANLLTNVELYANDVGAMLFGNGTPFPMAGNLFTNLVCQNNVSCGLAAIDTQRVLVHQGHFETNGTGGSITVDGETIDACKLFLDNASITLSETKCGSGTVFAKAKNNSRLTAENCAWTTGTFVDDGDDTTIVYAHGSFEVPTGQSNALFRSVPTFIGSVTKWGYQRPVAMKMDRSLVNLAANQVKPTLANGAGIVGTGTDSDSLFGDVSWVHFSETIGSIGAHRVTITPGLGTLQIGDRFAISLLVRANAACSVVFDLTSGSFATVTARLSTTWKKIVLYGTAASSNTPLIYIYPADTVGASVYVSHLMVAKSLVGAQNDALKVLENDAVNFTQYSPYLKNSPTLAVPALTDLNDQTVSSQVTSSAVTVTGDSNAIWPVMVRGDGSPELQINSQAWATEGTIRVGDTVKLRLTSSGSNSTESVATLYYPEGSQAWSVTTEA